MEGEQHPTFVYKLCTKNGLVFDDNGEWGGSHKDIEDGFIHLSIKEQVPKTAQLYYDNLPVLLLLRIKLSEIEHKVKWEWAQSRNTHFPHIYGTLSEKKY